MLGVCRGMQLMAVHAGGSLDQHTPDVVGHDEHSPGGDEFGGLSVRTRPAPAWPRPGRDRGGQCHHHQSVREHPGFVATAWRRTGRRGDGAPGDRFCVGVQWHPETGRDQALFAALVAAAAARR